ncbi:MAG: Uma2 family endonuclease [Ktedonobacteraceae bacterium]
MALHHHSTMSVEEYLEMDRSSKEARYEYIDGYVRLLAGGTLDHATIGLNIASLLRNLLRGSSCRVFTSDARVRISETRYVYPDVTVSCDGRDRGRVDIIEHPRLVVEVLSTSTEDYDRGRKFTYYRECPTIQEYVLVNTEYNAVEVCRHEKNSRWSFHVFEPGDDVELVSLAVHFPVSAVYDDVTFSPEEVNTPA